MAIKNRRGPYNKFDPTKLLPGEWAVVLTGDPNASDGLACYMCFGAGVVKRMATYEDMVDNIAASSGEVIAAEVDRQCKAAIQACQTATNNAESAASAANTAASNADTAASSAATAATGANSAATAANEAAQAAQSVIQGDLSSNTVTFATAAKQNLVSGETLGVLFGKLYRWIASLGTAASKNVANNLTTTAATSFVLDARQGAVLNTRIGLLKSLNTTNKGSLVGAVNEVHDKINGLNEKVGNLYLAKSLLTPTVSGDTTLAALIKRLSSKGYLYGQASIGNYPELPVQSWTYTVRWQFTFDSVAVVEIQQLYTTTKQTRWLNITTGAWTTDNWN